MEEIKTETSEMIEHEKNETIADEKAETPEYQREEENKMISEIERLKAENESLKSQGVDNLLKEKNFNPDYAEWVKYLSEKENIEYGSKSFVDWLDSAKLAIFKNNSINDSYNISKDTPNDTKTDIIHNKDENKEIDIEIPGV